MKKKIFMYKMSTRLEPPPPPPSKKKEREREKKIHFLGRFTLKDRSIQKIKK